MRDGGGDATNTGLLIYTLTDKINKACRHCPILIWRQDRVFWLPPASCLWGGADIIDEADR